MLPHDIAKVANAAGFSGEALLTAVAVALAESGGNERKRNPVAPDDSYGLWQINMRGAKGPARRAQFNLKNDAELFDPATNARAAFAISNGGANWNPWTTYTSGAYKKHLGAAITGMTEAGLAAPSGIGDQLLDAAIPAAKAGPGLVAGGVSAAAGFIPQLLGLDDLGKKVLAAGLAITFTVAALGLIAMGLFRLTGADAGDTARKLAGVAGGPAGTAAALAS